MLRRHERHVPEPCIGDTVLTYAVAVGYDAAMDHGVDAADAQNDDGQHGAATDTNALGSLVWNGVKPTLILDAMQPILKAFRFEQQEKQEQQAAADNQCEGRAEDVEFAGREEI